MRLLPSSSSRFPYSTLFRSCTTAATVNRPRHFRFGTVGPAMPGVEVKADNDGELLIKSETIFAGYLKDEEATRGVLTNDGWRSEEHTSELQSRQYLVWRLLL